MSKTGRALIIKFVMTYIFTILAFQAFVRNPWDWVFLLALAVTVLNYLAGDILILPSFGNTVASVGDGLLAMLLAHISGVVLQGFSTTLPALVIYGALIALGEYQFHKYLNSNMRVKP